MAACTELRNVATMKREAVETALWTIAAELMDLAFRRYCRNPHAAQYLWVKPSTETEPGSLDVAEERPDSSFTLAETVEVPRNATRQQMANWVYPIIRRQPILPFGVPAKKGE